MSSVTYSVRGLTCAACMADVMESVGVVPGVTDVAVDLVVGGVSRLTASSPVPVEVDGVREAIRRSGFDTTAGLPTVDDERSAIGVQLGRVGWSQLGTHLSHNKAEGGAGHEFR